MKTLKFTGWLFVCTLASGVAHAGEKLQLWPYIENAAIKDEHDRRVEGASYLIGGTIAIALPFATTHSGSALRDVGTYTLVPVGIYSVLYGGVTLLTDSPWVKLKRRTERLAGPEEDTPQWRLRREAHARSSLLERADRARYARHLWGGIEAGAGVVLLGATRSTASIATAAVLFGLSAYHFLYRGAEERLVEQLDQTTAGVTPKGEVFLAVRFNF